MGSYATGLTLRQVSQSLEKSAYQFEIHVLSLSQNKNFQQVTTGGPESVPFTRASAWLSLYNSVSVNIAHQYFFVFGKFTSLSIFYCSLCTLHPSTAPSAHNHFILSLLWFLGKCSNIFKKKIFCFDITVDSHAVASK